MAAQVMQDGAFCLIAPQAIKGLIVGIERGGESERCGMRIGFESPAGGSRGNAPNPSVSSGLSKVWSGVRSRPAAFRI
jgi:hypothetical protein